MNIMSINLCGVECHKKRWWVKKLCINHYISMLGIQDLKLTRLDMFLVKSLWCDYQIHVASSSA